MKVHVHNSRRGGGGGRGISFQVGSKQKPGWVHKRDPRNMFYKKSLPQRRVTGDTAKNKESEQAKERVTGRKKMHFCHQCSFTKSYRVMGGGQCLV